MSIKKLDTGEWLADFRPNGRGGRRYRKKFSAKAEAVRYESYIRSKVTEKPDWEPPKKDTRRLSDLIAVWYKGHGKSLKDGASRKQKLEALARFSGNPRAKEISESWYVEMRNRRIEDGVSLSTVNHDLAYLKALFNELARLNHWDGDNPIKKVRKLKQDQPELSYLRIEQIKELLDYLKKLRDRDCYLITKICLSTGARWSEAETLRPENISDRQIAFVSTKNGKPRYIPISKSLGDELREFARGKKGRLFKSSYDGISEVLEELDFGLPRGQRTHVFRHTFASHFMMNGGNILTLQRILDHSSLAMTMRYAHLAPEHLSEAVEKNPVENL